MNGRIRATGAVIVRLPMRFPGFLSDGTFPGCVHGKNATPAWYVLTVGRPWREVFYDAEKADIGVPPKLPACG